LLGCGIISTLTNELICSFCSSTVMPMSQSSAPILSQAILQSLLQDVGLLHPPESLTLLGVSTCAVWTFSSAGQQYVVRARLDGDSEMLRKETFLSDLLRRHAVPAPLVLASIANDHGIALLQTWLPGIPLAQALDHLGESELAGAWHSVGQVLRRIHSIVQPVAGEIVADCVQPFPGGWSNWLLDEVVDDISWLETRLGNARTNPAQLDQVVAAAKRSLEGAPICLLHNDALPHNILVAPGPEGWCCTGWLDWEFARVGDPHWDLATLDFRPARQVPETFFEGYGARPAEPQASVYELLMATWRTRAELEQGSSWTWPTQQARLAYLHSLPEHIDRLAALFGVGA
jgi:aminoglycoside phosphotransferase (APT) family kinase protein